MAFVSKEEIDALIRIHERKVVESVYGGIRWRVATRTVTALKSLREFKSYPAVAVAVGLEINGEIIREVGEYVQPKTL